LLALGSDSRRAGSGGKQMVAACLPHREVVLNANGTSRWDRGRGPPFEGSAHLSRCGGALTLRLDGRGAPWRGLAGDQVQLGHQPFNQLRADPLAAANELLVEPPISVGWPSQASNSSLVGCQAAHLAGVTMLAVVLRLT
jgi:hypothetical protein